MKKYYKILSFFTAAALVSTFFAMPANAVNEKLIWSDEFDGSSLNTNNWVYDVGYGYWGNNELEYYRSGTNNIKVEDGCLAITAKKESYGGANYTSGRITTCRKQLFKYGTIEARIKMPAGQGLWPAFWMLGETTSWPNGGEIDIMEHINRENTIYGTGHDWNNGNTVSKGGQFNNIDVTQFHLYKIDWTSEAITWYIDDKEYFTLDISEDNGYFPNTEVFHEPYYLLLNLAVGGDWPGNPVDSSFPSTMYVDYVRVYENAETEPEPPYYVFKPGTSKTYVSALSSVVDIGQPCVYNNGRAYLPLRAAAAAVDCPTVEYNSKNNTVRLINPLGIEYILTMNSTEVLAKFPDGSTQITEISDKPIFINGRACLPIRPVANIVDAKIEYFDYNSGGYVVVSGSNADMSNAVSWIEKAEEAFDKQS